MFIFAVMNDTVTIETDGAIAKVSVYICKGKVYVAYCPSLDLSGAGENSVMARHRFVLMLSDYLLRHLKAGTLKTDLMSRGWTFAGTKGKGPSFADLLKDSKVLQIIIEQPEYTKVTVEV